MKYEDLCIDGSVTIRDAMRRIDLTARGILFIQEEGRLQAVLTDGDVRRYLLGGGKLEDSVMRAGNRHPRIARNAEQAKSLYHERNFVAIPIVDAESRIIDVYMGEEGPDRRCAQLDIPVVINAGGKGTRLDPYTKILPKPLIPIGDLPIIEHIMRQFQMYGCNDFHVIVNYKKQLIKAFFGENENHYNTFWYDEEKPLGTGGGLSLLKGKIDSTFFFTNCDILLQSNYESMLRFHRENHNAITMICAYKNLVIPYGVIEMGVNGSIERIQEKPELSFLTNTGMYIVEPEVLEDIEDGTKIDFPDIAAAQQRRGRKVAAYPVSESEWMDMGQLPELEEMRKRMYNG